MQAARGLFVEDNWGYAQLMRNRRFTTLIITTISSSFSHLSYFFFALPSSVILFLRPFIGRLIVCICKPLLLPTLDACIPNRVKTPQ
jgi:hypothetical protein